MERKIKRGDMYYAALSGVGSEQAGSRPVLIISNDIGNNHSRTVIVATITSKTAEKADLPTHCYIQKQQGIWLDSLVLMEQIRTIDKSRLKHYIGTLNPDDMSKADKALAVSMGLCYIDEREFAEITHRKQINRNKQEKNRRSEYGSY